MHQGKIVYMKDGYIKTHKHECSQQKERETDRLGLELNTEAIPNP